MSLEEYPDGRIKVRWRVGDRHPSKTFSAKHEPDLRKRRKLAKRYLQDRTIEADLGVPPIVSPRKTLREVMHEFIPIVVEQKAPKTQEAYRSLWNAHLSPAFGGYPVTRITSAQIDEWVARSKVGVVTKQKALVLLGQVFKFAQKRNYVRDNPVALVDKPKIPVGEPVHPPTPLDVERIRKAFLERERYVEAVLVSVIAYSGARPLSEALALTRGDVREKTLLVRAPKTNSFRPVDLLPPLAEDLKWWMARDLAFATTPLLPNGRGEFWTQTNYDNWRSRVWHGTKKNPGPAYGTTLKPKDLRHTFVSLLIRDENYSRREIADQAGHNLDTQDRVYSHVWAELRGTGSAVEAIREARGEVFGNEAGRMAASG